MTAGEVESFVCWNQAGVTRGCVPHAVRFVWFVPRSLLSCVRFVVCSPVLSDFVRCVRGVLSVVRPRFRCVAMSVASAFVDFPREVRVGLPPNPLRPALSPYPAPSKPPSLKAAFLLRDSQGGTPPIRNSLSLERLSQVAHLISSLRCLRSPLLEEGTASGAGRRS